MSLNQWEYCIFSYNCLYLNYLILNCFLINFIVHLFKIVLYFTFVKVKLSFKNPSFFNFINSNLVLIREKNAIVIVITILVAIFHSKINFFQILEHWTTIHI